MFVVSFSVELAMNLYYEVSAACFLILLPVFDVFVLLGGGLCRRLTTFLTIRLLGLFEGTSAIQVKRVIIMSKNIQLDRCIRIKREADDFTLTVQPSLLAALY